MRLLIISDDDGLFHHPPQGQADVLVSCGDLLNVTIQRLAQSSGCRAAFAVRGNHDRAEAFPEGIANLHLRVEEFEGVRFGGFHGGWRYKSAGYHLWDQHEVIELMSRMPTVDVFVAHNSPRGVHERDPDVHQGFDGFAGYIARARPRYFVHGHQHANRVTQVHDTVVIGVHGARWLELD